MKGGLINSHEFLKRLIRYDVPDLERKHQIIQEWNRSFKEKDLISRSEQSLKTDFLTQIFKEILGYEGIIKANPWTMEIEVRTEMDATTPDAVLGYFSNTVSQVLAVVEVKKPSVNLDEKQNRKDQSSPVNQAFAYQHKHSYCEWIIVSNIREIRLYSKDSSTRYESFWIEQMAEDILLFEKFCFFLSEENLIRPHKSFSKSLITELYISSDATRRVMMVIALKTNGKYETKPNEEGEKKLFTSFLKKLEKTEHRLGDFVSFAHGVNIPKEMRSDTLNSFDFARYLSGSFEKYEPYGKLQYFERAELDGKIKDESPYYGKRVLVSRYDNKRRSPWQSMVKANLAEESFFHSKKLLGLSISDDRLTPEYVTALLNSRLVGKWHRLNQRNRNLAEILQVVSTDLKKIPIALPNKEELELVTSLVRKRMQIRKEFSVERERFLDTLPDKYSYIESYLRDNKGGSSTFFNALEQKASFNEQIDLTEIQEGWNAISRRFYPQLRDRKLDFDLIFARIYELDKPLIEYLFNIHTKQVKAEKMH